MNEGSQGCTQDETIALVGIKNQLCFFIKFFRVRNSTVHQFKSRGLVGEGVRRCAAVRLPNASTQANLLGLVQWLACANITAAPLRTICLTVHHTPYSRHVTFMRMTLNDDQYSLLFTYLKRTQQCLALFTK